jgi:signal peptidase II
VAVLAADIISKAIVAATLSAREVRLLGGLLILTETRNPGAAFSLGGPSETIVFSAIAIGVVIYIIRAARRIYSLAWAMALGLLLGGATGNLTDRIFRSPAPFRGWVVDWIELPHWPVFNLADSAITCGGVLMVVLAVLGRGIEGKARPAASAAPPGPVIEPGRQAPEEPGADRQQPDQTQPEQPQPEQPQPELSELEQPVPGEPRPDEAGPVQSSTGQSVPEESVRERSRPEWPEPDQPRSEWPRPESPGPGEPKQGHPARGSNG